MAVRRQSRGFVGWRRIWINTPAADVLGTIDGQIAAVNRLLRAEVLSDDVSDRLRDVLHTLAAVKDGEPDRG
jgi:hypothetical protein